MMLDLARLVESIRPGLLQTGQTVSVAKIETTRPLYLLFAGNSVCPALVVQFGPQQAIERLHCALSHLHDAVPDLVSESLVCAAIGDGTWMHVQRGLAGVPWFRLQRVYPSLAQQLRLRSLALSALRRFQSGVAARAEWRRSLAPGAELRRQLDGCLARGGELTRPTLEAVLRVAPALDAVPPGPWPWQHGDFCFNNLLVDGEVARVIDLEEFGDTVMPLHDELSLALSCHDLMGGLAGAPALCDQVHACVRDSPSRALVPGEALQGLLFCHMLWRLNQCATRPRRAEMRHALRQQIESMAAAPLPLHW